MSDCTPLGVTAPHCVPTQQSEVVRLPAGLLEALQDQEDAVEEPQDLDPYDWTAHEAQEAKAAGGDALQRKDAAAVGGGAGDDAEAGVDKGDAAAEQVWMEGPFPGVWPSGGDPEEYSVMEALAADRDPLWVYGGAELTGEAVDAAGGGVDDRGGDRAAPVDRGGVIGAGWEVVEDGAEDDDIVFEEDEWRWDVAVDGEAEDLDEEVVLEV